MSKVLVELHVPAIDEHFDTFVPVDVPVRDLVSVIADGVAEITNDRYITSKCEQLCMVEPVGMLSPALCLEDYGIKDGMQLFLV